MKKESVSTRQESQVIAVFDFFKAKLQLRLLPKYKPITT
jgi:hypothetical protein